MPATARSSWRHLRPEGNICLGMLDAGTGHYPQAASEFQLAIDSDPTNDLCLRRLASVYESLGRMKQAKKTYQKAIQAHPEDPSNYAELGTLYEQEAHYDEAAAQFEKAVKVWRPIMPTTGRDWAGRIWSRGYIPRRSIRCKERSAFNHRTKPTRTWGKPISWSASSRMPLGRSKQARCSATPDPGAWKSRPGLLLVSTGTW